MLIKLQWSIKNLFLGEVFNFSELKRFKNRIFDLKKLDEFKKLTYLLMKQIKKLLSNTPNSTKKWVNAQVINQDYELQNIQLRYGR